MNNINWNFKINILLPWKWGLQSHTKDYMVFMSDARLRLGIPGVLHSPKHIKKLLQSMFKAMQDFL